MVNKRVQYTEGSQTEPLPNPTTGLQYLRRNSGNTGWELVTLNPGVANLGEVLSNGNTTDGYDIVLSVGDAISSADGYVNVSGHLSISNGLDLSNKKITSVLDPTSPQDASTKNYVDTHIVQLTAVAPVNVDKSAAVIGVSTTSARSDHKHNITTAIAVSVGNNNAEGTATSLARSDHTHSVSDLRISGQAEGDILFFNGTNWARLGAGIDGYVLTTNGNSSGPSWKISEAVTNLSIPGQAQGDILYYNGINWVVLPPGQDGYVLTTHSTGENPTWTPKFDNISASSAAAWYVNALTGNDNNDGFTAGTALKTSEELCRRICPGFAKTVFTNLNTIIHFAAGSYGALDLNIDFPEDITYFEAVVSIQCAYTSTAPMTITSVVNTVPGVSRGQITVTGGTLTHGKRIRAVSGSHEGCWTYSTGSNGGSTTNHFVGSWLDYNANTSINIDNGSSVVLDTLQVSFSKINLKIRDRGYAEIRDAQMPVDGGNYEDSTENFLLYLAGCEIPTSEIYGDVDIYGCKISDLVGLVSGFVDFHNNYFTGRLTIYAGSYARINSGNCFDGGGILHPINDAGGGVCNIIASVEFENGVNTYPAIDNQFAGTVNINSGALLWGFSTSYAIGINISSGANAIVNSVSQLMIPATQQLVMVGNNLNYSNVPINYPNSDCSFVLASDGYSTPYVDVPGQIQGDVLYFNGTNWTLLPPAQDGYVLTTHGILNNPTWAPASLIAQTAVGLVAAWYVNASTGSDTNDGRSSGTAFKTVEHLSQVLCPNGIQLVIQQNVNVYIAAGSYGKLVLNVTSNDNTLFDIGLAVWGTVSQSITGNVTSVVNTFVNGASSIRGQIAVASGTLVNHQRMSQPPNFLTDQTGGWYTGIGGGAIGFSNGLIGDAQHSFVTSWCDDAGHYGYVLPTGQPISVDTLQTTIACLSVEFIGNSWGAIVNCILPDVVKARSSFDTTFHDHFLIIAGCDISGSWTDVHVDFEYCRTVGDITFNASFVRFFGQSVQHQIMGVNQCFLDMHSAGFDAGTVVVDTYSEARLFGGEFENGSFGLTAFKVFSTCSVRFDGPIWGVTGLYGVGFDIAADANVTMLGQLSYLQLPSTTNVVIAGNRLSFSAVPVAYPTIGSFFALSGSFDGYLSNNPNIVSFSDSIPFVPNWYVDASIGSDANDGRTSGTAFATTEKLSQILCPFGTNLIIQQNVAVHIAAGTYNSIQLNITFPVGSNFTFDIFCDFTSSAPITLATVINTVESATPTRGEITTASGTFAAGNRIRSTSGAQSGAITYCTGLNGVATDGYVKTWFQTTTASIVSITSGTTCVVDTLQVTINRVQIKMPGNPIGGTFIIHDAILPFGAEFINQTSGSASVYLSQCKVGSSSNSRVAGNSQLRNCQIVGSGVFSTVGTVQPVLYGCEIETTVQIATSTQIPGGCCFNGGILNAGIASSNIVNNVFIAATEWTNGSGLTAINIAVGGSVEIGGQQYGFGSAYAIGFSLTGGAYAVTDTVAHLAIPAVQQLVMAGNNLTYAKIPISYPTSACTFALLSDTTAVAFNIGGLHTVIDNTARDAYPTALRQEGMILYSEKTQCYYELQSDLTTWVFYDANPNLASQTNWYIDPSGSNDNDGSSGHPLLDLEELSRRLCPHGKKCFLTNDIRIDLNSISLSSSVSYGELDLNVDTNETLSGLAIFVVNVICAVTSSSPITLNTVVIPSGISSIRGELTTLSGTFVNQERIRITSGTTAGAVCYSTGLNGSAQDTFVSVLSTPTIASILLNGGHGPTATVPAPGDTCVVDTLTVSINRAKINCSGFAQVFIQDAKIIGVFVEGYSRSIFAGSGGNVYLSGCVMTSVSGAWICNSSGAFLLSCRTPSADSTTLIGTGWCIVEHAVQGRLTLDGMVQSYGITLDGGHLVIGQGTDFNHPGQSRPSRWIASTSFANGATGGAIEAENGASGSFTTWPAVTVSDGSYLQINDFNSYCWGASSAYGIAFQINAHAYIVQGTVADGRFAAIYKIPSTVNFVVANLYFAYSDNPIYVPNSDCGLISAASSFIGNNLNQEDQGFYLVNQSGNLGPITLFGMTKAGLYNVTGYISTTTIDAAALGNPILNIIFTDDSGVARTVPVASSPLLTSLGGNGGSVPIESVASGTISWSVTGIGNAGNSKYSIRMRISKISMGA